MGLGSERTKIYLQSDLHEEKINSYKICNLHLIRIFNNFFKKKIEILKLYKFKLFFTLNDIKKC
jgi:hypothetical protein